TAIEHLLPRAATVSGLEDAARFVVGPLVTGRRHIDDVRVGRGHDEAGDRLRVGQTRVDKRPRSVGGLVDAYAGHRRAEEIGFTGADPDDVRIRRYPRNVADTRRGLMLEHGLPRDAVVIGLPHPAR